MITNCQGGMIFNYNSSNVNNLSTIAMATQETSLCIYFNSSQSGSVCNYVDELFILEFVYHSVNDCGCQQSSELHLNAINNSLTLPTYDAICLNVSCLNCIWHVNIDHTDPNHSTHITYGHDFQSCNSRL